MQRGLDVRDFTMATFGGSGSLLLCRLVDILGLAGVLVPRDPGNVSAYGLLTVDVRNDYVRTAVSRHDDLDLARTGPLLRRPADAGRGRASTGRASRATDHRYVRSADLRYAGQAFEVRVPAPDGPVDAGWADLVADDLPRRARAALRLRLPRRPPPAGRVGQPAGVRHRPDRAAQAARDRPRATAVRSGHVRGTARCSSTPRRAGSTRRSTGGRTWRAGDVLDGPAVVEEFGSTVPLHPGFRATVDRFGNLLVEEDVMSTRRPGPAGDRAGLAGGDRDGGRDGDRPHRAVADDPRRARLPGRHPRPAACAS